MTVTTSISDESQATARARRLRLLTIAAIAAVAGLSLITTTQTWWTLHLASQSIPVAGTVAAPALAALSLCGLALAAALSIAGPVFRLILGLIQLVLAFTIILTTVLSLVRPDQPSESLVSTATGVAGSASIAALIKSVAFTPWGVIAIVFGAIAFILGLWLFGDLPAVACRLEKISGRAVRDDGWSARRRGRLGCPERRRRSDDGFPVKYSHPHSQLAWPIRP